MRLEEPYQRSIFRLFGGKAGADPGFDEGGSDKRPPKAVAPRGGPGTCPPGKFLILGPLKCDFQRFQGQFEVV